MREVAIDQIARITRNGRCGWSRLLLLPVLLLCMSVALAEQQGSAETEAALRAATNAWATAWANHDAEAYLNHYAADFVPPDNLTRAAWENQRRQRLKGAAKISIQIDWVGTSQRDDGSVEAHFIQNYRSASYSDRVLKTLTMKQEGGAWKIVREGSTAVTEQALAAVARPAEPKVAVKAPAAEPPPQKQPASAIEPPPAEPQMKAKEQAPVEPAKTSIVSAEPAPAPAVARPPQAPVAIPTDEEGREMYEQIQQILQTYDLNYTSKFLIDINFLPMLAMSGYRQMLQWSAAYPAGNARRDDIVGMVREGMDAVVRYSAVGIPLSGWKGPGQPISVIYGRSFPRYEKRPDPAKPETLRWSAIDLLKQASPASIGESLSAKALTILQDRSAAGQEVAPVLLASALEELNVVAERLFLSQQLGPLAKGAYVPDVLELDEKGTWQVIHAQSLLKSQAALLQGLVYVNGVLSSSEAAALFTSGSVQGKALSDWRTLARRTLEAVYDALNEHHWDGAAKSFVSEYDPKKGRGAKISLEDAMAVADALNTMARTLPADDVLAKAARERLLAQADFVKAGLANAKGSVPAGFVVSSRAPIQALMPNLLQYVAAISVLLQADDIAGQHGSLQTVTGLFENMRKLFWSEQVGVYRVASGFGVSGYEGHNFGSVLRWLQRMEKVLPALSDFGAQTDNMLKVVLKGGSLIQSEGPSNGEILSAEQLLAQKVPAFVEELKRLPKTERRARMSDFILQCADQDGDGIPGIPFAGGEFGGGAPVMIGQTSVNTPFETPEGTLPRL